MLVCDGDNTPTAATLELANSHSTPIPYSTGCASFTPVPGPLSTTILKLKDVIRLDMIEIPLRIGRLARFIRLPVRLDGLGAAVRPQLSCHRNCFFGRLNHPGKPRASLAAMEDSMRS